MLLVAALLAADPSTWLSQPADAAAPASFGTALPISHPGYDRGSGFDKPPSYFEMEISITNSRSPAFPEAARAAHLSSGTCSVTVVIDAKTGSPTDVKPATCESMWFANADAAVRTWHFERTPAPPSGVWSMVVPVTFQDRSVATK